MLREEEIPFVSVDAKVAAISAFYTSPQASLAANARSAVKRYDDER